MNTFLVTEAYHEADQVTQTFRDPNVPRISILYDGDQSIISSLLLSSDKAEISLWAGASQFYLLRAILKKFSEKASRRHILSWNRIVA